MAPVISSVRTMRLFALLLLTTLAACGDRVAVEPGREEAPASCEELARKLREAQAAFDAAAARNAQDPTPEHLGAETRAAAWLAGVEGDFNNANCSVSE